MPSSVIGVTEAHAQAKKKQVKNATKKRTTKKNASRPRAKKAAAAANTYNPPYAAIVVDHKTAKVLHAENADAIRHPASITKVMTLYILFDELERGTLTLNTPLRVSAEAARQSPSKIGVRPGETIRVEDAIKALVTKSANDVAVVIAENISGSESAFAQRMTRRARSLGMRSTVYRNASGLPNPQQVTTARDLAILGRAVQDNHPKYFKYFSTRSFAWRGQNFSNHNRLLGNVNGVDGIKTGFVRASGFNLLTSVNHEGRQVVAVVLGGRSGASRDARMRELVQGNLKLASSGRRTAPMVAAASAPSEPAPTIVSGVAVAAAPAPAPMPVSISTSTPSLAASVPTPMPRPADQPDATLPASIMAAMSASQPAAPEIAMAAVAAVPHPAARPPQSAAITSAAVAHPPVQAATQPAAAVPAPAAASVEVAQVLPVASEAPAPGTMSPEAIARRVQLAMETTTPGQGDMRWVVGAQPKVTTANAYASGTTPGSGRSSAQPRVATAQPLVTAALAQRAAAAAPATAPATIETIQAPVQAGLAASPIPAPQPVAVAAVAPSTSTVTAYAEMESGTNKTEPVFSPPPPGWQIQVAATPDASQVKTMFDRIAGTVKSIDKKAEPYTEPVEKNGTTLYRVRYAGFSERTATQACRAIKQRASMSCFTLKN